MSFLVLVFLISDAFLARLAKWSHPCKHWQPISIWQELWAVPMLPSFIRFGTIGEFPLFFPFWSAVHFLNALPNGPILATVDNQLTTSIFLAVIAATPNTTVPYKSWHQWWVFIIFVLLITHTSLACLASNPHPCNFGQLLSFWQWLLPLPTLPSLIRVGTTGIILLVLLQVQF